MGSMHLGTSLMQFFHNQLLHLTPNLEFLNHQQHPPHWWGPTPTVLLTFNITITTMALYPMIIPSKCIHDHFV
jgi:hypothetical protein